jgi:hypothetical protein
MQHSLPALLLALFVACPGWLSAQVESHPYLGVSSTGRALQTVGPADAPLSLDTDQYLLGLDLHFGRRSLTPLAGLGYRLLTAEPGPDESLNYHVLSLPLGLAYRLLPADLDLNLVPHLALLPTYTWETFDRGSAGYGLDVGLRTGVSAYLHWATLGVQYRYRFTGEGPESRRDLWSLVVGIRL